MIFGPMIRQPECAYRIRVWDIPTRLAHWAIVVLFCVCWWTAKSDRMEWHSSAGLGLLGVVLFRLAWGFVGSDTARFGNFVFSPRVVLTYARDLLSNEGVAPETIGHNPMGGWSVLSMLALLLTQAGLGLISVDVDAIASGPLAKWVTFDGGRRAAHLNGSVFYALLSLVALHITVIFLYDVAHRAGLLSAMIHGLKPARVPALHLYFAPLWRAAAVSALTAIAVALLAGAAGAP
jgi:cytochrome b